MTRDTSIDIYYKIKEEGLLSKLRFEVYDVIFFSLDGLTANEVYHKIKSSKNFDINDSYHQRLSELKRLGVIESKHKRICSITRRMVYVWKITNKLPKKDKAESITSQIINIDNKIKNLMVKKENLRKKLLYQLIKKGG